MAAAPKVLIAEDDALQAIALRMALAECGFDVCAVVDTSEAAIAVSQRAVPDIAILDVALACGSNGLEAAAYYIQTKKIPVIVCSAHAISLDVALAGAAFFLRKPYLFEDLSAALSAVSTLARHSSQMDGISAGPIDDQRSTKAFSMR